jgi:hypothetical protein
MGGYRQENVLIDSPARIYVHWFHLFTVSPTNDERANDGMNSTNHVAV